MIIGFQVVWLKLEVESCGSPIRQQPAALNRILIGHKMRILALSGTVLLLFDRINIKRI
jgi:hypothetical protein